MFIIANLSIAFIEVCVLEEEEPTQLRSSLWYQEKDKQSHKERWVAQSSSWKLFNRSKNLVAFVDNNFSVRRVLICFLLADLLGTSPKFVDQILI